MVDPPAYRIDPDPDFADRLERRLLQRLTAPTGSQEWQADAGMTLPGDTDTDDRTGDIIMLDTEDRPTRTVTPRRRSPSTWLMVAAAAVVVAVVGTQLVLDGDDEEIGTVTAPPTSTSGGSLPVGPHVMVSRVGSNEERVAVTIPAPGWFAEPDQGSLTKDLGGNDRVTVVTVPGDRYQVPENICSWQAGSGLVPPLSEDAATRAHELVLYLGEQTYDTPEGSLTRDLSDSVAIPMDDASSVTGPLPDIDPGGCDEQRFCSLQDSDGNRCLLSHLEPNALVTYWVWDGPGDHLWVVAATSWPTTSSDLLAEMAAIVDSMKPVL